MQQTVGLRTQPIVKGVACEATLCSTMNVCVPSYSQDVWTAHSWWAPLVGRLDNSVQTSYRPRLRDATSGGWAGVASRGGIAAHVVDAEGKQLVDACVAGDAAARARFHVELLPLIYRFERGGSEHESASRNFLDFLFDDDRLYRRLRSYRGDAPLRAYLWSCIFPDLMKQFRATIRRQRFETVSIDDGPVAAGATCPDAATDCAPPQHRRTSVLDRLSAEKRLLLKLLYIEDFDLDAGRAPVSGGAQRGARSAR